MAYVDGERKAWGDRAVYTPADQMLVLNGSPRVVDGGMTTTSRSMRLNRATGDAFADGDVKSTYSDLKAQPNGALLAASDPIHVTARTMTAHSSPAVALYTGEARLWQDANVIQAPSIEFDRNHRSVVAQGYAGPTRVHGAGSDREEWKSHPGQDHLGAPELHRQRAQRRTLKEAVQAKGAELTITARSDGCVPAAAQPSHYESIAYRDQARSTTSSPDEQVVITQPGRRATGRSAGLHHCLTTSLS